MSSSASSLTPLEPQAPSAPSFSANRKFTRAKYDTRLAMQQRQIHDRGMASESNPRMRISTEAVREDVKLISAKNVESESDLDKPHPPSFYCPISRQCMHDPVILTDGHTYERRHIELWLSKNNTSPVSGARLQSMVTTPNHALRNAIEEYFEQIMGGHRQAIRQTIAGLGRGITGRRVSKDLMRTIDALMQCSVLVNADLCIERVLKRIMVEAKSLIGAEVASVFLVDQEKKELYSTVNSTGGELRIPISSGVAGHVASSGKPLIIRDAYADSRFNTAVDAKTGFKTRNIMCVPVQSWKWGIIGVAQLINKTDGGVFTYEGNDKSSSFAVDFSDDDQHFFQVLAAQAAVSIVNSGIFEPQQKSGSIGVADTRSVASSPPTSLSEKDEIVHTTKENHISFDFTGKATELKPMIKDEIPDEDISEGRSCRDTTTSRKTSFVAEEAKHDVLSSMDLGILRPLLEQSYSSWEMDVLSLAELSRNRPLSMLGMYLFEHLGLIECFGLDKTCLMKFFSEIERGYSTTVPYHNGAHAASVMHFMFCLLFHGGIAEAVANSAAASVAEPRRQRFVMMVGLVAAAVHDFEHKGLTNDFLVKSMSPRARRYNDKSVNENHHASAAFEVLHQPGCNFLEVLSLSEYRLFRSLVIDLVLGTDMAENAKLMGRFQSLPARTEAETVSEAYLPHGAAQVERPEDALLSLQMALKCADIGHLALPWSAHVRWVKRLEQEFFTQGDMEKTSKFHDSVSFLMDREKPGVSQTQLGFFDIVVLPMFGALVEAFPSTQPMERAVVANYHQWKAIQATTEGST